MLPLNIPLGLKGRLVSNNGKLAYLSDLKQSNGYQCILNAYNNVWYAVGFDNSEYYCLADENLKCKEYPADERSSGEDACYRGLLSEDWSNILNCGEHHSIVFGCSGYDGCGSGQHWCRYLRESGVVEIVVTTESTSTEMSSTEMSSTEMSSTEMSSTEFSSTEMSTTEIV